MKKKTISVLLCAITILSLVGCGDNPKTKDSSKDTANVSNTNSNVQKEVTEQESPKEENKEEKVKEESKILFDDEFAKITYTGIDRDGAMGPGINVEVENKSDQDITIQLRDVSVDGYMVDPVFSVDILKGKKAKGKIDFLADDVDKNFKSIEGKFKIMPKDDFINELKIEPFTINY